MLGKRRIALIVVIVAIVVVVAGVWVYGQVASTGGGVSRSNLPAYCSSSAENGTGGNWTTYHGSNARTGNEPTSPITSVQKKWSTTLDGQVYAQPLLCGNTIYVATEQDSVYAVNATSGTILWQVSLGTPVPASDLPCGDIDPSGITGTPVIDLQNKVLYVVAFVTPVHHYLFGLDLTNGSVLSQVSVDPPNATADVEQQRGALLLENGMVYIPYGGLYGDCGQYHGYVLGVPTNGSSTVISYQVPTQREGAIWGTAGFGVAANGSLYVSTGNGASDTTYDYGDSVIELSPALHFEESFAPSNWVQLNLGDTDLGSVAPTVLPNGDVFQIGKAGVGYLLSGTSLGGIGGQLGEQNVCSGAYGSTARIGPTVYVPCTNGLFAVTTSSVNMTVTWASPGIDAGSPIVTGNIIWTVDTNTATLHGYYVSNGTAFFSYPLGASDHFISPAATSDALVVTGGSQLFSFSLA